MYTVIYPPSAPLYIWDVRDQPQISFLRSSPPFNNIRVYMCFYVCWCVCAHTCVRMYAHM